MNKENYFDTIVIGSGIGGLAAASILAQMKNQKVLVLERHFKIGGFTHIFKRNAKFEYEWDVGLHYIGEMQPGTLSRSIFDFITQGKLNWQPMPEVYDKFVYPGFSFPARKGRKNFEQDLISRFPGEESAIHQYFIDIRQVRKWFRRYIMQKIYPPFMSKVLSGYTKIGRKKAVMTTKTYLDKNFKDERLKAILVSQWGDYGLPPSMSTFGIHATVTGHYFNGGYFPVGGSKKIGDSIIPIIESKGGQLLINHFAEKIIIKDGKATGVKVLHKNKTESSEVEFFADNIISNCGAYTTFTKLLPEKYQREYLRTSKHLPSGAGHVSLYIGFKESPESLGFKGENHWIYDSVDHELIYNQRNELITGKVNFAYLSFPSLKNPEAKGHTAEIISIVDMEPFKKWSEQPWKKRDESYKNLKDKIANALIAFVEKHYPGFRKLIDYSELSTPLTTEFFTGHQNGTIYGIPAVPDRYKSKWIGFRTPVKNLYLAGADTPAGHGIVGAMMGGVVTAGILTGIPKGIYKIFKDAENFSKTLKN